MSSIIVSGHNRVGPKLDTGTRIATPRYSDRNFTNYGTDRLGGTNSFHKYLGDENIPVDSFRQYSRDTMGHKDNFVN